MNTPEGQQGGLRLDSVIDCTVIATIPRTLLVSKIGSFPQEIMERVDQCLMVAMAIGRPIEADADKEGLPSLGFEGADEPKSETA
jgi:hypothetical protein